MTFTSSVSRKRSRNCQEEGCEFMPISKRINNLHIRSQQALEQRNVEHLQASSSSNPTAGPSTSNDYVSGANVCFQHAAKNSTDPKDTIEYGCSAPILINGVTIVKTFNEPMYRPELSASENPHYYNINCILFQAHQQRIQRLAKLPNGHLQSCDF
ncbi:uncharacterized protein LOC143224985 [Tachypleus tridentatus]|uniref:uncharacterized protein LOC143224985 n=1 Tax=Tachypleus tridentatus TaxID=6853 RepID=UPI003FD02843